jgi:hypothetical protein
VKTDGNELVTMAPSMVTVGIIFKGRSSYKFIRKIEHDDTFFGIRHSL